MKTKSILTPTMLVVVAAMLLSCAYFEKSKTQEAFENKQNAQQLAQKAQLTFQNMINDPNMGGLRESMKVAKGVLIVPQLLKGAFIFGASGGSGVFLARSGKDTWNGPAFYTMGGASFGLQAGAEAADVILVAMTDRGLNAFKSTNFKLGADAGIAIGPMGAGRAASTANVSFDILSYSKAKGLYGGISLSGAVVDNRQAWDNAYYGKPVTASEIFAGKVRNPESNRLRTEVAQAAKEGSTARAASPAARDTGVHAR